MQPCRDTLWRFALALTALVGADQALAQSCLGTDRTWTGASNNNWSTGGNWSGSNAPDTNAEDAIIVSASRPARVNSTLTVGCVDIQSGEMRCANNTTLTVEGDSFHAASAGLVHSTCSSNNFTLIMGGSADQELTLSDEIAKLTISNNHTVTVTDDMTVSSAFSLSGATTTLMLAGDLTLSGGVAMTIPSGVTVQIEDGATLSVGGNLTVNGTLKVKPGGTLKMATGTTLTVGASTGVMRLEGSPGLVARLTADSGNSYSVVVNGTLYATYFKIDRLTAAGVDVVGTLADIDNGEFHYLAASGYALTLRSGSNVPATWDTIGFFNDAANSNVKNVNANAINNPGGITIDNWSGTVGGASFESDTNNSIAWGSQAGTKLILANNTASGSPPATIAQNSSDTLFATFAFSLSATDTATDITQLVLTMSGSGAASDVAYVKLYKDAGGGTACAYDAGTDTQIGSDLTLAGTPPQVTVDLSAGTLSVSNATPVCVHVVVKTTTTAADAETLSFQIAETDDVTNSLGYSFSDTAGPPVSAGAATIVGDTPRVWDGSSSTAWSTSANWTPGSVPSAARDCQVGSGANTTLINVTTAKCQNATLKSTGTLDFNTSNPLSVYGALVVESGHTFQNAASATISMTGSTNQALQIAQTFPGNLTIANTGTAPSNEVTTSANASISGNLTVSTGRLVVSAGTSLTVGGNVTVASGATLEIEPNGTLILGNGSVVTINGTLQMVGSSSLLAKMTSTSTSNAYSVVVNGTIQAQHYSFAGLGTAGVSIEAAASIDSTYHLQDGTFSYPIGNSGTLLKLKRQVPSNAMDNMSFMLDGAGATGTTAIDTTGAASGTLTIDTYTGDLAGEAYTIDPSYDVSWTTASTTIDLSQSYSPGHTELATASTYNMGRFGLAQHDAGASLSDASITSLKLTLTGTAIATDISAVRAYFEDDCNGSGGALLGTGSFSGSPPTVTFSPGAGTAVIDHDAAAPPTHCVYVEYDIAANAVDGHTAGVSIASSAHFTTDVGYAISSGTPPPVTLGAAVAINQVATSTTWTGATDTDWSKSTNWTDGLPTLAINCTIVTATNAPVINGTTGICKNVTIQSGSLTLANGTGAKLQVYGNFSNQQTFTQNDGTLEIIDNGVATTQSLASVSSIAPTFAKTAGGSVTPSGTLTLSSFSMPGSANFMFDINASVTVVLSNGGSMAGGTFQVQQGGTLKIGDSKTFTVSGGTFQTTGVEDAYPQSTSTKALITRSGSGRYSFVSTGGTLNLCGFIFDYLDVNGLQVTGTTTLANFKGGQLTHLSTDFSTPVKALQLNASGNMPATASNIGFMWDDANSYRTESGWCNCGPSSAQSYYLVYAPACNNSTIAFTQWFGDFFTDAGSPNTEAKIYDSAEAGTCNITMTAAASPVALVDLIATPYAGAVAVDWATVAEVDHAGFNVYRSESPGTGYAQVNRALLRSPLEQAERRKSYRFVDLDAADGATYYYYVEDIAINGSRQLHGPVHAIPDAALGAPPAASSGTNPGPGGGGNGNGGNGNGGNGDELPIDLGAGAIAWQRPEGLRVEINPGAPVFAASNLFPGEETATIAGYSHSTEVGHPELPERTLLVEVDPRHTTVAVLRTQIAELPPETHSIAPAPAWSPGAGGALQAIATRDDAFYQANVLAPSAYFSVDPELKSIGGRRYALIKVQPLRYAPVTGETRILSRLVIELGLDDASWSQPPTWAEAVAPAAIPGTVRLRIRQEGMHALTYDELAAAGLDGPFVGRPLADLRLYRHGEQVALEILGSGDFDTGDELRFFAAYDATVEDREDELVLAPWPLDDDAPARIATLDATPGALPAAASPLTFARARREENLNPVFDRPIGDLIDRLYWQRIFVEAGTDPDAPAAFNLMDAEMRLDGLAPDSPHEVLVLVDLAGRGAQSVNPTLRLGLRVNDSELVGAMAFPAPSPQTVFFRVPASYFFPGVNLLTLQALGDTIAAGDYGIIDVAAIQVDYFAYRQAIDDRLFIYDLGEQHVVDAQGFTSADADVYDVSVPTAPIRLTGLARSVATDDDSYQVSFAAYDGDDADHGYRYEALTPAAMRHPARLIAGGGFSELLRAPERRADLLVIGSRVMLAAARSLIDARRGAGLDVVEAPLEQIYAEFSDGRAASAAIKRFIAYAFDSYTGPPARYVLFLGDATYDPNDDLGYGPRPDVVPMPIERGEHGDFGDDHWFVAGDDRMPRAAVGRIPAASPIELESYIDKLLAYEDGERAPQDSKGRELVFIADRDTLGEGFAAQSAALAASTGARPELHARTVLRGNSAADPAYRAAIRSTFASAPLLVTYLGHGAEDRWASDIFENADAAELSNGRLPIVLALNCLNAYFYDADPDYRSLGETMLLNADGGAVAFIGSTAMTAPTAQQAFASAFLSQLASETAAAPRELRLGDLFQAAKLAMGVSASTLDSLRSFSLLGDPSSPILTRFFRDPVPAGGAETSTATTTATQTTDVDEDAGSRPITPPATDDAPIAADATGSGDAPPAASSSVDTLPADTPPTDTPPTDALPTRTTPLAKATLEPTAAEVTASAGDKREKAHGGLLGCGTVAGGSRHGWRLLCLLLAIPGVLTARHRRSSPAATLRQSLGG